MNGLVDLDQEDRAAPSHERGIPRNKRAVRGQRDDTSPCPCAGANDASTNRSSSDDDWRRCDGYRLGDGSRRDGGRADGDAGPAETS